MSGPKTGERAQRVAASVGMADADIRARTSIVTYFQHGGTLLGVLLFPFLCMELGRKLSFGLFFLMSPIAIDRSKGTSALKRMAELGRQRFAQGFWIVIFPEGTRTLPHEKREYSAGGAMLAVKARVPVVPVALNSGDCWPRGTLLKRAGLIRVVIGEPIATENISARALSQQTQQWIEAHSVSLMPESTPTN